jgi:hypothetical protein
MLIRMRLLRACQIFLSSGLLLVAGQAISAQSIGKVPSQPPSASPQTAQAVQPAQVPSDTSANPQTPPESVIKLSDVVRMVEKEGGGTSIRNYVAEDLGLKPTSVDSSPVQARALQDDDTWRKLYVIDGTGDLLFMMKNGDTSVVYLANHAGVLQLGGYFYSGRLHSQEFKPVSKEKAAAGFAGEKEFWLKKLFPREYGDAVKPEKPVSKPDHAQAVPVNSNQQSSTDGNAAPAKKKISWF